MLRKVLLTVFILTNFRAYIVHSRSARIGSGRDVKPGESLDFVSLSITFQNQYQKCGGSLIAPQYVLTSATCVFDPVEGVASVINMTFPQYRPIEFVNTKLRVIIHPQYNSSTYSNDIAIIKLTTPMVPDGKLVGIAKLATNNTADVYVDRILKACGTGSTTNYPRPARVLQCTDLYGVPAANCGTNTNVICTQWTDRDNNICNGDYGGPLYESIDSRDGVIQTVIGIAHFSPDYRTGAPCLGAHKVSHTSVAAYMDWITSTLI